MTYLAGARVVINYVITTDDGFEGYSISLGSNNTGNNTTTAFITNTPLVPGQTYEFTSEGNIGNSNNFGFDDFACFAAGTLISTINGNQLVEHIKVGDLVTTRDYGDLAVTWIGKRTIPGVGKMAPILFRSGAFSVTKDLIVSPNHRMLFSGYEAELLFGEQEILVPAKALINDNTILRVETGLVTYVHLMFEEHQIICANGAWSESFFAGQEALGNMDDEQLQEFYELFPEKRNCTAMRPARPIAKSFEGKLLS
ncbi:MAG: Hint domain-containing protein [Roseobacter sp.]